LVSGKEVPMSPVRWTTVCLALAGTAWLLAALGPSGQQVRHAVTAPQALVDSGGPDALLVVAAAAAGWLCWAWGALGLLLTATSALPGAAGRVAGLLLVVVLPAGARRAAAVTVGLSLAAGTPALAAATSPAATTAAVAEAAATQGTVVADWPAPPAVDGSGGPPDWPTALPAAPAPTDPSAAHVVLRGECLWDIAADRLARLRPGRPVRDADVAREVAAWWQVNAAVIGPDPDLLLPGQVLQPPH
jgi:hypothetical protein